MSRGNTGPRVKSPLPQENPPGYPVQDVRVVDGFMSTLPGRTRIFFQRVYFSPYPRPLQKAGLPPFPFPIPVARFAAPMQQVIVIKHFEFRVYQATGIGIDDIITVPASRVTTYFGFSLKIGNRGVSDFSTNVQAPNPPNATPHQGGGPVTVQAGSSVLYPFAGQANPTMENFATYARPGDPIEATAFVLRPPNFDTRLISVELTGWLSNESELDSIVSWLSGQR